MLPQLPNAKVIATVMSYMRYEDWITQLMTVLSQNLGSCVKQNKTLFNEICVDPQISYTVPFGDYEYKNGTLVHYDGVYPAEE